MTPVSKVCGRCSRYVLALYPPMCEHNPAADASEAEPVTKPTRVYPCPDCGAQLIEGLPHPLVCAECFCTVPELPA